MAWAIDVLLSVGCFFFFFGPLFAPLFPVPSGIPVSIGLIGKGWLFLGLAKPQYKSGQLTDNFCHGNSMCTDA